MHFIEMTGGQLMSVLSENEATPEELKAAGLTEQCLVRINQQGDIEVRRNDGWDSPGSDPCGSPRRRRERNHAQIGRASPCDGRIGNLPLPPGPKDEPVESGARRSRQPPCPDAHTTRTCGAICAYVLGPMPSTSCSSSIRLNLPCCCRQARMA